MSDSTNPSSWYCQSQIQLYHYVSVVPQKVLNIKNMMIHILLKVTWQTNNTMWGMLTLLMCQIRKVFTWWLEEGQTKRILCCTSLVGLDYKICGNVNRPMSKRCLSNQVIIMFKKRKPNQHALRHAGVALWSHQVWRRQRTTYLRSVR